MSENFDAFEVNSVIFIQYSIQYINMYSNGCRLFKNSKYALNREIALYNCIQSSQFESLSTSQCLIALRPMPEKALSR